VGWRPRQIGRGEGGGKKNGGNEQISKAFTHVNLLLGSKKKILKPQRENRNIPTGQDQRRRTSGGRPAQQKREGAYTARDGERADSRI